MLDGREPTEGQPGSSTSIVVPIDKIGSSSQLNSVWTKVGSRMVAVDMIAFSPIHKMLVER